MFFWPVFSCIRTEYRKIQSRKNSVFEHFSRCGYFLLFNISSEAGKEYSYRGGTKQISKMKAL